MCIIDFYLNIVWYYFFEISCYWDVYYLFNINIGKKFDLLEVRFNRVKGKKSKGLLKSFGGNDYNMKIKIWVGIMVGLIVFVCRVIWIRNGLLVFVMNNFFVFIFIKIIIILFVYIFVYVI